MFVARARLLKRIDGEQIKLGYDQLVVALGSVSRTLPIPGLAEYAVGPAAPWYVLAAVLLGACVRAVDVEARGLFVRGGLHASV